MEFKDDQEYLAHSQNALRENFTKENPESSRESFGFGDDESDAPEKKGEAVIEEPAKVEATPAIEEPVLEPEVLQTPEEKQRAGLKQYRVYAQTEDDIELLGLMRNGLSAKEASAVIESRKVGVESTTQETLPDPIETAESRIVELEKIIDEAGELNSIMTPEIAAATKELMKLNAQLAIDKQTRKVAEQNARLDEEDQAAARFEETSKASQDYAVGLYPSAMEVGSPLADAVNAVIDSIKAGDPSLGDPDLPAKIIFNEARRLGIAPQTGPVKGAQEQQNTATPPVPEVKAAPTASPRQPLLPAGKGSQTVQPSVYQTPEIAAKEFNDKLASAKNSEEAIALMREKAGYKANRNEFSF